MPTIKLYAPDAGLVDEDAGQAKVYTLLLSFESVHYFAVVVKHTFFIEPVVGVAVPQQSDVGQVEPEDEQSPFVRIGAQFTMLNSDANRMNFMYYKLCILIIINLILLNILNN